MGCAGTGRPACGGDPGTGRGRVVTDSRTAQAGDLFVALRGPRFDGHDFVPDVIDARGGGGRRRACGAARG